MTLALDGGPPVRIRPLPYARQSTNEEDLQAVVAALQSDWLTTGPRVDEFERELARALGNNHAVAVCNGTAALHCAAYAMGIGSGDEVLVPSMTFAASANCVAFLGGRPVFVDVDPDTLLIDPEKALQAVTPRTQAILAVDYAGQPCDYDRLSEIAGEHSLGLIADACHAPGATYRGRPVGSLADVSTFSFHPVKHFTSGEGGAVLTADEEKARRMKLFRNHGILTDHRKREQTGTWFYEMVDLGYNYRLTDLQCALGMSQLRRLPGWVHRRRQLADHYRSLLANLPAVRPLAAAVDRTHSYHLFPVRLDLACLRVDRGQVFAALRAEGIGVNVHYIPVHLHPYYRERFGTGPGLCPVAEQAYQELLSLPMFPLMSEDDADDVVTALDKVIRAYAR